MSPQPVPSAVRRGGEFLIAAASLKEIFTPEDFSAEHTAIAKTTEQFYRNEVTPHLEAMLHDPVLAVAVMRKSAELGLTSVALPERYGGMELDLVAALIVAEGLSRDGSYGVWHSVQTGIGAAPILFFGTEDQKRRYLPRLASCELIAAYALTEAQAGSDALAVKTRAELDASGSHYVLNGQKMWISNAGGAGLFTIFAKVNGEQFTAFLIERETAGLTIGAEEKKMGIKGSSTCALYLDNVRVPVENVLGEIGRGHIIAFNCLNLGRLKLGAGVLGGAKHGLALSLKYAKERTAFGKSISEYGLIQQKLGEMAVRVFAAESLVYRVAGDIQAHLAGVAWEQPDAAKRHLEAFEEFAAECAMVKVFATEALDFVVDEGVQIHGGYGFHQDYAIERAYRDSRINRIFEGTNEINRLLASGMLIKRAQRGRLALPQAVKALQSGAIEATNAEGTASERALAMAASAKKAALVALGSGFRKHGPSLDQQQEVLAAITDIAMYALAMESAAARAEKKGGMAAAMCAVFAQEAMERVEQAGRAVIAACTEGDQVRVDLDMLERLTRFAPVDAFAVRRGIAARLVERGRYVV